VEVDAGGARSDRDDFVAIVIVITATAALVGAVPIRQQFF